MKSMHSLLQRPCLFALMAGWLGVASCTEAPQPCSLLVMDAHGQPPDSGFVVLVKPNTLSNNTSVLGWTVVSDTLHWNPLTGLVLPAEAPPSGSQWKVCSPNPFVTTGWRNIEVPFSGIDSCVLPIEIPWEVHLRANRTMGHEIEGYGIAFSSDLDPTTSLIHTSEGQGGFHLEGTLRTHAFPVHLTLWRRFLGEEESHLLAEQSFDFPMRDAMITCHWGHGNSIAP